MQADVNSQGGEYGNALQAATYGGHKAIVQLLLDKQADVNAQGGYYGNALQASAYGGHQVTMQLLLCLPLMLNQAFTIELALMTSTTRSKRT